MLVHPPALALLLGGAVLLSLINEVFVDLIANWLALPCLFLLVAIAMMQLIAVPMGINRAFRANAWRQPGVWLALAFAIAYALLVAYLALAALYAAAY